MAQTLRQIFCRSLNCMHADKIYKAVVFVAFTPNNRVIVNFFNVHITGFTQFVKENFPFSEAWEGNSLIDKNARRELFFMKNSVSFVAVVEKNRKIRHSRKEIQRVENSFCAANQTFANGNLNGSFFRQCLRRRRNNILENCNIDFCSFNNAACNRYAPPCIQNIKLIQARAVYCAFKFNLSQGNFAF